MQALTDCHAIGGALVWVGRDAVPPVPAAGGHGQVASRFRNRTMLYAVAAKVSCQSTSSTPRCRSFRKPPTVFSARCPVGAHPARSDDVDDPLRQRICRQCGRLFAICAACDRGHTYCTPSCRTLGRRRSVRAARDRHQRSPEGRLDHRDRQRAYRVRRRVTDQTSPAPRPSARLSVPDGAPVPVPAPARCVVCGRSSRWLIPLREPRVGRRRRDDDHARATMMLIEQGEAS